MMTLEKAIGMLQNTNEFCGYDEFECRYNDGTPITMWNMAKQSSYMNAEVEDIEFINDKPIITINFYSCQMWD